MKAGWFGQPGETAREEIGELFRQMHKPMYRVAKAITHNEADAEDIVMAVFTKIIPEDEGPRKFQNPRAYLFQSVVNQAIKVLKWRERKSEDDMEGLELPAPETGEDVIHLREALAAMDPELVAVFDLYYNHGYSHKDIGRLQNKSTIAVGVQLHRARKAVRKQIRIQEKERETQEKKHQRDRSVGLAKDFGR